MSFMMRNDINIALVSMVRQNEAVNNSITSNATEVPIPITDAGGGGRGGGEFEWSTLVQSMILSSFYACYVLSQVNEIGCYCYLIMNFRHVNKMSNSECAFNRWLVVLPHSILVPKMCSGGHNLRQPHVVYVYHWHRLITIVPSLRCVRFKVLHRA